MKLKAIVIGIATAAALAIPTVALADWGQVTGSVNLRTGPGANYHRITTLPAGARIWVNGSAGNGWVSVTWNNNAGFVSGKYVATGYANNYHRPPMTQPYYYNHRPMGSQFSLFIGHPPAPTYGYWRKPWWDQNRQAWYDGHRWYHNGVWYNDPSGFSFGFNFGG